MKEMLELDLPDDLQYTTEHEYAKPQDGRIRVGLSDYAQDQLGDIVFVELPNIGDSFRKGEEFGTTESVKAVVELYMPIGGEILALNTELEDSPELVNQDPYGNGWMIEIEPTDLTEKDSLMDRAAYLDMLKGHNQ